MSRKMKRGSLRSRIKRHPKLQYILDRIETESPIIWWCPMDFNLINYCDAGDCSECWHKSIDYFYKNNPMKIKETQL